MKVLRFGTFDDVNMLLFCKRGEIHLVPNCPTRLFSKNHIGVTVYLLNGLLLGISSHGYVKDILWVLGYNNFYANIGIAHFILKRERLVMTRNMTKNVTLLMAVSVNNWLLIVIYNNNVNFG